jgi:hypothetical protein
MNRGKSIWCGSTACVARTTKALRNESAAQRKPCTTKVQRKPLSAHGRTKLKGAVYHTNHCAFLSPCVPAHNNVMASSMQIPPVPPLTSGSTGTRSSKTLVAPNDRTVN